MNKLGLLAAVKSCWTFNTLNKTGGIVCECCEEFELHLTIAVYNCKPLMITTTNKCLFLAHRLTNIESRKMNSSSNGLNWCCFLLDDVNEFGKGVINYNNSRQILRVLDRFWNM